MAGAKGDVKGRTVIAASMSAGSYILPALVAEFQTMHPESMIQVQISNPQSALESVLSGKCDYAVMILAPGQNPSGLKVFPLWEEPLLLACAPQSRWVGAQAEPVDLRDVPFISTSRTLVMRELEEREMRANGITSRRVILELGHPEAQKVAVKRDLGVCFFLESSTRDDVRRQELRIVSTPKLSMSISLFFVHRTGKEFSGFQNDLARYIRDSKPQGLRDFTTTAGEEEEEMI